MRRLAVLVVLLLAVAVPSAAAQTEPARLTVTATADRCSGGLPVVDYTVSNRWSTAVSVQTWWLADASVWGEGNTHDLGPAPASATGSFTLPYGFYATVTVYATASWPDGRVTTNASWAIPVVDCGVVEPAPTPIPEPPPTTIPPDDGNGQGNGNGNGNGNNGNGNGNGNGGPASSAS
jgi:hypothetical protein